MAHSLFPERDVTWISSSHEVSHLWEQLAAWEKKMKFPAWPGVMEYEEEINGVKMRFAV